MAHRSSLIVIFLSLTMSVCQTVAQVSAGGWTPENMITYESISATAISPNGNLIAYTVAVPQMDGEKSEYLKHIWLASSNGVMNRQFTTGEKSCNDPAFSPDSRRLAFLSARGENGKNQIWIMPVDGGEAFQLTKTETGVNNFAWSPQGNRIAFTMTDPQTEQEKTDKKEKRDMRVLDTDFKYSHLYIISLKKDKDGHRNVQRLTSGHFHIGSLFDSDPPFDWSPDGKNIVFQHRKTPRIDDWPTTDISVVPTDSGIVKPLVNRKGADGKPRYSPDGKKIAFLSDGGNPKWAFISDIYVMPARGGKPKKLAETPDRQATILGWSADSKMIYFTETDHTSHRLFKIGLKGQPAQIVSSGLGTFNDISLSPKTQKFAFVYQTTEKPAEVFMSRTTHFKPKKLSSVHEDFPNYRMGKTEIISWRTKDGKEIEGLLTYPVNYEFDKSYPLILNIHGGPTGVYTQTFTARRSVYPIQAFAQQGYAVLRVNPRGSSGYGKAFRFANYNDWGFGDYDDLMSGVDKVIGMGVAHPDSLCVMGWSYGGFMTSFIITKSNRFKAASVGAGVTNLMSFTGTSDIPGFLPDYFGGEFWDHLDTYMKHSAMFNIKGVTIPTQIIHGEKDNRVPISQGRELYNALKRQGCLTEMIVYPRTPHGPREPKFIEDIGERIISWFDENLHRKQYKKRLTRKY